MKEYWSSRISGITPYTPGEQPKDRKFIKLNTNENPYPPAPGVLEAIEREAGSALRLYPDPETTALKKAGAAFYGIPEDRIFFGNGSDEVLAIAFQAFFEAGKTAAFPDITYSFYPVYCDLYGIPYKTIPLNEDFTVPVEQFCTGEYAGIVICNPNAPTGVQLPLDSIVKIIESNPQSVVIVDEAYIDFGGVSALGLIDRYENLLVIQTMSKSRSLAGMRVGMAMGCPNLIAGLNAVKNSFNSYTIDRLAIVAGSAAFEDRAYFEKACAAVIATRERTAEALRKLGFLVHPSCSNFLFASHASVPAAVLKDRLREKGILVRYFALPRIDNYLRISIGTDEEMDALCTALDEILKEG